MLISNRIINQSMQDFDRAIDNLRSERCVDKNRTVFYPMAADSISFVLTDVKPSDKSLLELGKPLNEISIDDLQIFHLATTGQEQRRFDNNRSVCQVGEDDDFQHLVASTEHEEDGPSDKLLYCEYKHMLNKLVPVEQNYMTEEVRTRDSLLPSADIRYNEMCEGESINQASVIQRWEAMEITRGAKWKHTNK